jgi:hypothetical protein
MYFLTTQSSAIFEIAAVSEIGRNCLQMSLTGLVFMRGTMLASFQDLKDLMNVRFLFFKFQMCLYMSLSGFNIAGIFE